MAVDLRKDSVALADDEAYPIDTPTNGFTRMPQTDPADARAFEALFDFIGERRYSGNMIQSEVLTHEGYEVPRDVFATFFGIVAREVREACGADWTDAMAGAWRRTLADLDYHVRHAPA